MCWIYMYINTHNAVQPPLQPPNPPQSTARADAEMPECWTRVRGWMPQNGKNRIKTSQSGRARSLPTASHGHVNVWSCRASSRRGACLRPSNSVRTLKFFFLSNILSGNVSHPLIAMHEQMRWMNGTADALPSVVLLAIVSLVRLPI